MTARADDAATRPVAAVAADDSEAWDAFVEANPLGSGETTVTQRCAPSGTSCFLMKPSTSV